MSKGLDAFKNIFDFLKSECVAEDFQDDYDIVIKELKALEVIKTKKVDVWSYNDCLNASEREWAFTKEDLTQEEIKLLDEVLLCE